jgi:hypothetical protein
MTRFAPVAALASACLALVLAGPASAGAHRIPVNAEAFVIPADSCGFLIDVGVVEDKEYIVKTAEGRDGSLTLRVTGKLILSLTNVSDRSKTFVRNVSGPAWATFFADGSSLYRSQGQGFGFNTPADQETTGLPGIFFFSGNLTGLFDSDGSAVSTTITGRVEDGCALLA